MISVLDFKRNLPNFFFSATLLLLFAYLFFCKYDVSRSTLWYYDFLSMNGTIMWLLIFVVIVAIAGMWRERDLRLYSLLAIVFLFSFGEVLTNYPMIWRDVFLHGSAVKGIINQGYIAETKVEYPQSHPGFFLLWSMVALVTGLDIFPSNLLLLLPATIMMLMMLLVLICRRLSINFKNAATLFAFLIMNFNMNEFTFLHFNTRLLSLVYTLLFLFLILIQTKNRGQGIGLLITTISLIISHILNSLVPVTFLAIYWLSKRKVANSRIFIFLSGAIIYAAWNMYMGYSLVSGGVVSFLNYLYINLAFRTISSWSPTIAKQEPFFGLVLGNYYKILLVALVIISLYSVVKLKRQSEVKVLTYYMLSILIVYGLTFFSALTWISIHRGIVFGSVSLAFLPMILFASAAKNSLKHWKHRILVMAIIILVIPHFILVHELPLAGCLSIRSIDQTSLFILKHRNGQQIVSLDDFPIYYCFYEPFYQGYNNLNFQGLRSLDNVTEFLITNQKASLKVLDYRQIVNWGCMLGHALSYDEALTEWDMKVYTKLNMRYNRVYCNGFEIIYS